VHCTPIGKAGPKRAQGLQIAFKSLHGRRGKKSGPIGQKRAEGLQVHSSLRTGRRKFQGKKCFNFKAPATHRHRLHHAGHAGPRRTPFFLYRRGFVEKQYGPKKKGLLKDHLRGTEPRLCVRVSSAPSGTVLFFALSNMTGEGKNRAILSCARFSLKISEPRRAPKDFEDGLGVAQAPEHVVET